MTDSGTAGAVMEQRQQVVGLKLGHPQAL